MADPGPAFRRGPARARASALSDSVIVYDGSRLLHWLNPLTGAEPEWAAMPDAGADPIACLTSCRDLNNHHDQLFAATESRALLSWTWRGTNDGGWYAWPSISLDTEPRALASWSLAPGHQQLVVAGADGQVVSQRREDWADWSAWELIGVIREVVALDALVSATGAVELYAVTADGELKRKINRSPLSPSGGWGGVETVTGWAEPAIALSSWSLPGEVENQAVLLRSGAVHQRWRRAGSADWSDWWEAPPSTLSGVATGLAGSGSQPRQQFIAALADQDRVALRRWTPDEGWQPWEPAIEASTFLTTARIDPLTETETQLITGEPVRPSPGERPEFAPPVVTDEPTDAQDSVRAEEATALFTGRELPPLEPEDPQLIGPFKLQRRVEGGQRATDKYVARGRSGWCFLKVLRPDAGPDEVTAFVRETEISRRVTDRHRLTSYLDHDAGGDGRPAYLALSFVSGKHLGEITKSATLDDESLVALARGLLEGLEELDECGVIHADLKPANVIMRDGEFPVIVDFGSAVPADTVVVREAAFGTTGYAAPEFVERRHTNRTTDVYSWGAVLVAAATGDAPAADRSVRAGQIDRLPPVLRELVTAALMDEPTNRPTLAYATKQLERTRPAVEVEPVWAGLPTEALPPTTWPARVRRAPARRLAQVAALSPWQYRGGLGIAALSGIIAGFLVGLFLITFLRSG